MKRTRKCPKCESMEVVHAKSGMGGIGVIVGPPRDPLHDPGLKAEVLAALRGGSMFEAQLERYVCCSCGYTEEWVPDKELSRLRHAYLHNR